MNLITQSAIKSQTADFKYSAATGSPVGAVGTYGLGIYIPKGALITRVHILSFAAFNGALATISFGVQSIGSLVAADPVALVAAAVCTTYAAGTSTAVNSEYWPSSTAVEITATLGIAASTAGRLFFSVEYIEFAWPTN